MPEKLSMTKTNEPILLEENQFVITGSYGHIVIDGITGDVVSRRMDHPDYQSYDDIVRFDVAEYIAYNGGMDNTDINLIGYWIDTGEYFAADEGCREEVGPEVTLKFKRNIL